MTTGERIRAVRKKMGLTQKQLADRCGMADSAIRKYESGRINPKLETIQRIATAMNADLLEFVDILPGDDNPKSFELAQELTEKLERERKNGKRVVFRDGALLLEDHIHGKKEPTPVSEDGLDEQDRRLVELMKKLSADQKEFLLAQLLTLTEHDKQVPIGGPQSTPAPQEGKDTTPAADGPETPPEG